MAEPNMLHIWKHGEKSKRKLGELKANVGQLQEWWENTKIYNKKGKRKTRKRVRERTYDETLRPKANKAVEYSRASKTFSAYDLVKTTHVPQQHRQ